MNKEFEVHKPNEQGFAKVTELAHGFDALLTASTLCSPLLLRGFPPAENFLLSVRS